MNKPEMPNPGSAEAVERGCVCPVVDNCYGAGALAGATLVRDAANEPVFWMDSLCPLHSTQKDENFEVFHNPSIAQLEAFFTDQ